MKILVCNKFYFRFGGVESYLFSLSEMQEKHGDQVFPFSMKHERNIATLYDDFFVTNVVTGGFEGLSFRDKLKTIGRMFYSFEAREKLSSLVKEVRPDIAHVHGIYHQISPSILPLLKKHGIPTVMTVQDYKLICPNYKFYSNDRVCEKCKKTQYFQAILNKCIKSSYLASTICSLEMYVHRFLKIYERNIDVFICPSEWLKEKMIEYGLPATKLIHIPNCVDPDAYQPSYSSDNYIVYFGRISEEKGLKTLVEAMKLARNAKLVIVGEGHLKEELMRHCELGGIENCDFVGYRNGEELLKMIKNSRFAVLPSEWYENCPLSVLEAFSCGKPVIGSDIGGIPELVDDGVDGLLFEPKNATDLAGKIEFLWDNPAMVLQMGKNARKKIEEEYDAERHYERIRDVYGSLLWQKKARPEV